MTQLALFRPLPEVSPASLWAQRWVDRRQRWRHAHHDGSFDPNAYTVEALPERTARAYIVANHYSGSYPAALRRYGLLCAQRLVGVAVLGVPTSAATLTNVFPGLEPYRESAVLSRFVLADEVAANGESWFLARVFHEAAATGLRGLLSFADPVARRVGDAVMFPGHVGTIYQATNAVFTGRSAPRLLTLLPNGDVLNERAKSKVRARERGHEAVERRLCALGATPSPGRPAGAGLAGPGPRRDRRPTAAPPRQLPLRLGYRRPDPAPPHRHRHDGASLPQERRRLGASTPDRPAEEGVDKRHARLRRLPRVNPQRPRRRGG